jgi:hypothetical protein
MNKDDPQIEHILAGHLNEEQLTQYMTSDQSDASEIHRIYNSNFHREDLASLLQ